MILQNYGGSARPRYRVRISFGFLVFKVVSTVQMDVVENTLINLRVIQSLQCHDRLDTTDLLFKIHTRHNWVPMWMKRWWAAQTRRADISRVHTLYQQATHYVNVDHPDKERIMDYLRWSRSGLNNFSGGKKTLLPDRFPTSRRGRGQRGGANDGNCLFFFSGWKFHPRFHLLLSLSLSLSLYRRGGERAGCIIRGAKSNWKREK